VNAELADRVRRTGGSITTPQGKASETISRGSVSGIASAQIRELLEAAAADGLIPWEAVDNVAPLVAHVTPQKAWQYAEDAPDEIREQLEAMIPAKRRTIKVDEAPV
jgi:carbon monoxide dehydrogenase subunit G